MSGLADATLAPTTRAALLLASTRLRPVPAAAIAPLLESGDSALPVARLTGAQSSGMLTSMSAADALMIVPAEPLDVAAGTVLRALPLDGDLGGSDRFLA